MHDPCNPRSIIISCVWDFPHGFVGPACEECETTKVKIVSRHGIRSGCSMEVEDESEPTFSFDYELLGRRTEVKVALCVNVRNEAEEEKEGYSV